MPELTELSKHIMVEETKEGLNIDIVDQDGSSMFPEGSKEPYERTRHLIQKIAGPLKALYTAFPLLGTRLVRKLSALPEIWNVEPLGRTGPMPCVKFWRRRAIPPKTFPRSPAKPIPIRFFRKIRSIAANRRVTITLIREAPPVPPDLQP